MLRRALAIVVTFATPVVGVAQQPDGVILQSAGRAAVGIELQSDASGNRRSMSRTWAGVGMIASGALLTATVKTTETCFPCIRESEWYKPLGFTGIGIALTGVLLATVWSDVPANPHIDLTVTSDRIEVDKTFGF